MKLRKAIVFFELTYKINKFITSEAKLKMSEVFQYNLSMFLFPGS